MKNPKFYIPAILLFLCSGCAHSVKENQLPPLDLPEAYNNQSGDKGTVFEKWWTELDDRQLHAFIDTAISGSFTLKKAYSRLLQAGALNSEAWADNKPALSAEASRSARWDADGQRSDSKGVSLLLSWEIDIWKRLSSSEKAAALEESARSDDLDAARLLLSTQVADTYFQILEREEIISIIESQIEVSADYLDLLRIRFTQGEASLVDVYQQRQQLASLKAQLPEAKGQLDAMKNRISVLSGKVPGSIEVKDSRLPESIPSFPEAGLPADLLSRRPDLRSRHKRLVAADYEVAEAVADRLPRFRIGGGLGIEGSRISSDYRFRSLFAELTAPVIDWGKRRAEVRRRKAIVEEELSLYASDYLSALEEVENAILRENEKKQILEHTQEQLKLAGETLRETRNSYMQGLTDYISVMNALQTKQRLEIKTVSDRRALISNRILLYRALGGGEAFGNAESSGKERI